MTATQLPSRYPGDALLAFRRDPLALLDRMAATGGRLVRLRAGLRDVFLVGDPETARELLIDRADDFMRGRALVMTEFLVGRGLLTSEGARHRTDKRLLSPAFTRERVAANAGLMAARIDEAADRWTPGVPFDAEAAMRGLALDVAADTLFGIELAEAERAEVLDSLDAALEAFERTFNPLAGLLNRLPTPRTGRLRRARSRLRGVIDRLVTDRRAGRRSAAAPGDLLEILLAARDGEGRPLDRTALRDHGLAVLLAGHETSGAGLTFALDLVARHPDWQARVAAEAHAAPRADPTALPLARRAFAEALRLRPPAWVVSREATRPTALAGVRVARGAVVLLSPWTLHRDPRLWPDPLRFDPDRFLPECEARRPRFAYLPFSAGRHGCIAEGTAWTEGALALAGVLRRWHLSPSAPFPGLRARVTLRPAGPVWLVAERL